MILFSFMLQIPLMRLARAVLLNMTIDFKTKWQNKLTFKIYKAPNQ